MGSHLVLGNSSLMGLLCGAVILVVLIQPLVFFPFAWKRGKALGLTAEDMKATVKSSMIFSVIPSLPILVSYLTLVPALGKYFPWLRLSVVGSATYETTVADMAAKSMGYPTLFGADLTDSAYISLLLVVSVGILGGNVFNLFFLKGYDKQVRVLKSKQGALIPVITNAMFMGLFGTLGAPYITNVQQPLNLVAWVASGAAALICGKLAAKHKKLKEFSFSISLIAGMVMVVVVNLFL